MRAFILRRTAFIVHSEAAVSLIGESNDRDLIRINRFLTRNGYPLSIIEPTKSDAAKIVQENEGKLPLVCTPDGCVFQNPSTPELADLLGLTEKLPTDHLYDLANVGAGPSGLSACVYAASEALDTIVTEAEAPGGQVGTSSKIENLPWFPDWNIRPSSGWACLNSGAKIWCDLRHRARRDQYCQKPLGCF